MDTAKREPAAAEAPASGRAKGGSARVLVRAFALAFSSAPPLAILNIALVVIQALLPVAGLWMSKLIVDAVARAPFASDRGRVWDDALVFIGVAAGLGVLSAATRALSAWAGESQSLATARRGVALMHAKAEELDLADFEDPQCQDLMHRAHNEAPHRPLRVASGLLQAGHGILSLLAMAGLIAALDLRVAFVLVLATIPAAVIRSRAARRHHAWVLEHTEDERRAGYYSWLAGGGAAKEFKLFGLGATFRARHSGLRERLDAGRLRLAASRVAGDLAGEVVAVAALFGAWAFLAGRTIDGVLTLGDLTMGIQAAQRIQAALSGIALSAALLQEDRLHLASLFDFLDRPRSVPEPKAPRALPAVPRTGLRFEDVSFGYPGRAQRVLDHVSFELRPGERLAIVGQNGAGKSTILKLALRFYDPDSGRITIDGVDLRELRIADLRGRCAALFQEFTCYDATAAENLRLGDVTLSEDDPAPLRDAVLRTGLQPWVDTLPSGLATLLGRRFRGGHEPSAGQWQRLALTRAFVRPADLVLLDEPSSALDPNAEAELLERLSGLVAGRMALLVSHRFPFARLADRILVLDQGRIVETGTHDELIAASGLYARLFTAQARPFQPPGSAQG